MMQKIEELLEDASCKIKNIAKLVFVLGCIAAIILAYLFGRDIEGDFRFIPFIVILLGGVAGTYIASLLMYAFGEAVDNVQYIKINCDKEAKNNDEIVKVLSTIGDTLKVRKVQIALSELGFECGEPNGVINNQTKQALIAYKKATFPWANETTKGDLDDFVIEALKIAGYDL